MLKLNNYTVRKIDAYNITWAKLKQVDNTKGRKPTDTSQSNAIKWVESYKYFGTLKQCLESIKNDILSNMIDATDYEQQTFLNDIERVQSAIDNLNVKINYDRTRYDVIEQEEKEQ